MKHLLLILAIFSAVNIGYTQHNSSFDHSEDFQLNLKPSSASNEFISEILPFSSHTESTFFTIAVYFNTPFSGNLQFKLDNQPWQLLRPYHEATHPNREIFELLFIPKETSFIQFKSDQNIGSDLSVRLLALTSTKQLDNPDSNLRDDCTCSQPDYCGRSCWCPNGNCPTDDTPVATAPTHIIVHHSATPSTSNDFPAVVRSIWDFHVTVNGWDDIGYNWLVDGNGIIYEGRGSGLQGAHFSCMNSGTTGLCMIGNFENSTPTLEAITSLENLIAWEACDKNIVPLNSSNHITSGELLANISGHRDGNDLTNSCSNTVCPGENLYPLLPEIRTRVSEYLCLNELVSTQDFDHTPFQIFPNPSNGYFKISGDLDRISSIEIFSQTGAPIDFHYHPNGFLELNNTGLYILKVIEKDGFVSAYKILVESN